MCLNAICARMASQVQWQSWKVVSRGTRRPSVYGVPAQAC